METLIERLRRQAQATPVFAAELIASLKMVLRADFEAYASEHRQRTGQTACAWIPTVMGTGSPLSARYGARPDPAALPEIILTNQLFSVLTTDAARDVAESGLWEPLPATGTHPAFAGTWDSAPEAYHLLAACPYVFLIDRKQLGGEPEPRCWSDLTDARFRGRICINGTKYGPDASILLWLYRRFGSDWLEELRPNVISSMHGSAMARNIGTGRNGNIAVYLSTAFFAYAHGEDELVRVVWPEDAAPFQPCVLLAKLGAGEKYSWIIDYLMGERFAAILNQNWYPTAAPWDTSPLEAGMKLDWFGWELLLDPDTPRLSEELRELFRQAAQPGERRKP